jgi:hypothetical protein
MAQYRGAEGGCPRCGAPLGDAGRYTTEGDLVCASCAARGEVAAANTRIATELAAQERAKTTLKVGAAAGVGCGTTTLVITAIAIALLLAVGACVGPYVHQWAHIFLGVP